MHQFASDAPKRGAFVRVRAAGREAPLRAAIQPDERLLVCAEVRFADGSDDRRLWLTDRRFLFIRGGSDKILVSAPIPGSALTFDAGGLFPIRLDWTDASGRPCCESFRSVTWKDTLRSGSETGAIAVATGGIEAAIIVGVLGRVVDGAIGGRANTAGDHRLYGALEAAMKMPGTPQPIDLVGWASQSLVERLLLLIIPLSLIGAGILAAIVFALLSFQARQAYEAAPYCAAQRSPDCRFQQAATLTSYRWTGGRYGYCNLTFQTDNGTTVAASLHVFNLCAQDNRGEAMVLKYWQGSVTAVLPAGVVNPGAPPWETDSNPEYNWRAGAIFAGLACLVGLVFAIPLLVTFRGWRARRALLRRSTRSAG